MRKRWFRDVRREFRVKRKGTITDEIIEVKDEREREFKDGGRMV